MSVKKLCDDFLEYAKAKRVAKSGYMFGMKLSQLPPGVGLNHLLNNESFWVRNQKKPVLLKFDPGLEPRKVDRFGNRRPETVQKNFLVFQNRAYCVKGLYSEEELQLLVLDAFDAERRKFEHLRNLFAADNRTKADRERHIPEDVRIAVWRRDGGKCVKCSSQERLEYDHIIPFSLGGSNTTRNVQLLCERCNRRKGGKIQ